MPSGIVVIGAGVMGAAVAADLARGGRPVTVLEAGSPAAGTSGATFSWTNSGNKEPRGYFDLNVEGMLAHRHFARSVASCDWYHERGSLEWTSDAAARQTQQRKVERLLEWGYQARWLDPLEVSRLEPDLARGMVSGRVAYFPEEGWVDPVRLVGVLLASARAAGAEVRSGSAVTGMSIVGDRVERVTTADGETLRVDAVVNCAGPAAGAVAALAGVTLPMRNSLGLLVCTAPTPVTAGRVIHAPRINLRPDGAGRLLLHHGAADSAVSQQADGTRNVAPGAAETMLRAAEELYPGIRGTSIEATRVGERVIPIDGLPVLGPSATVANLHFAVAHSGATLCLRVAELVGAEVRGDRVDELAPYRHARL
jgi:glycine/D-amino acid oxidase-like deaminating enzyme